MNKYNPNANFLSDDAYAKQIEEAIHRTLAKFDRYVEDVRTKKEYQQKDIDCIIYSPLCVQTVEIKADRQTENTDNIFLETRIETPKGIKEGWYAYTEAEYIYYAEDRKDKDIIPVYIFKTADLRQLVKEEQAVNPDIFKTKTFTKYENGRPKTITGILYPIELLPMLPSFTFLFISKTGDTDNERDN